MKPPGLVALLLLASVPAIAAETPSPQELLASAIVRHDPAGAWGSSAYRLVIRESRPDGSSRDTTVLIDNRGGRFRTTSIREGNLIVGSIDSDGCKWLVNGSPDYPDEVRDLHRLTCDRLERIRNYYVYLWGLPMKLRDPGTQLGDRVATREFDGREALELRVGYDEEVGTDVWYFYFEPDSHELIGYRFYHDESANDGEYITLGGIHEDAGLRLPKARAWYTHKEDKYLGTDTLMSIEEVTAGDG